jgi:GrpB-like predicted nucleotidyltransferase (UPF0157 family)
MPERVIEVVDPDPSWPDRFARERDRLAAQFAHAGVAGEVVAIEHIGSTAVPGLPAKPVIDIMIGLRHWPGSDALVSAVVDLGYRHTGESGVPGRHFFKDAPSRDAPRTRQIHAVEHGGRLWRDHLYFRDHLRESAADRHAYATLKRKLARTHRNDIVQYIDGKRDFIRDILDRHEPPRR